MEEQDRGITKTQEKTLGGDRYTHYLGCGDGLVGVLRC